MFVNSNMLYRQPLAVRTNGHRTILEGQIVSHGMRERDARWKMLIQS